MKSILLITFVSITMMCQLWSQIPGFNYQAVLRDAEGQVMENATLKMHFSLSDADGNLLFREVQDLSTDELGQISTMIGSGTTESGNFADLMGVSQLNLQIEAELPGEPDVVDFGTAPVGTVPYALYGEDADADPANEMQSMSIAGDTLNLSGVPGLTLNSLNHWQKTDSSFTLSLGAPTTVRARTKGDQVLDFGRFGISLSSDDSKYARFGCDDEISFLELLCEDLFVAGWVKSVLLDQEGRSLVVDEFGGTSATGNHLGLTTLSGALPGVDPLNAYQIVFNGLNIATMQTVNSEGAGNSNTNGENGALNTLAGTFAGSANHGAVMVFGEDGSAPLGYLRATGTISEVAANVVTMLAEAPGRSAQVAAYAAPMGGEAAAYDRGTARLVNGEATIVCPEHFRWVADPGSMTVTITPLSATSKGIAVVEKGAGGFKVKELGNGDGNYEFDYLVMCKRKAHEDFEVLRDREAVINTKQKLNLAKGPQRSIKDLHSGN